jgi:hypothetical protein
MPLKIYFFVVSLLIVLLFTDCKTVKKISNSKTVKLQTKNLIDSVFVHQSDIQFFSAKFDSNYKSEKQDISFSGNMRVKKDSIIWISISPFAGIEAFRIILTPDSVKYLNRFQKTYFSGDYSYFKRKFKFNFDYNLIQSVILNNFFIYGYNSSNKNISASLTSYTDSAFYIVQPVLPSLTDTVANSYIQTYYLNNSFFKICKVAIDNSKDDKHLQLQYTNFSQKEKFFLPSTLNVYLKMKSDYHKMDLTFTQINFGSEVQFSFKIPEKYDKIAE